MDRPVTTSKSVTSPTWGPPPSCKQALNLLLHLQKLAKWPGIRSQKYKSTWEPSIVKQNVTNDERADQ